MADRYNIESLSCSDCIRFNEKLKGMRHYNPAFIEGSKNLRALSFKDHAAPEIHTRAMLLLKKEQSSDVREYVPMARALHGMDLASQLTVKRKFDVAFVIAKEHLPFMKMKPLCE